MSTTPEGKVKKEIKAYLDSIGAYHFWPVQTGYGAATVDCLACVNGKFIAIEVKHKNGRLTPRQIITMNRIEAGTGIAFVARSAWDVQTMLGFIEAGKYKGLGGIEGLND